MRQPSIAEQDHSRYLSMTSLCRAYTTLLLLGIVSATSTCSILDPSNGANRSADAGILMSPRTCTDERFAPRCGFESTTTLTSVRVDTIGGDPYRTFMTRYTLASPEAVVSVRDLPGDAGKLKTLSEYTFRIELMPILGRGALQVYGPTGLVLSVVTLTHSDDPANPPPPQGWDVTSAPLGIPWSDRGCGTKGRQRLVKFSVGSESVGLLQGGEAMLGDYHIYLLVAEEIDYSGVDCLDFELPEISYVIGRAQK